MPNRSLRLLVSRLTVALLLFAQGAMAWSTCEWLKSSAARAVQAAAAAAPCHETLNASVCLTHCLSDSQAVQEFAPDIPAMPSAPVLRIGLAPAQAKRVVTATFPDPAAGTGPPRRILLQSFQV